MFNRLWVYFVTDFYQVCTSFRSLLTWVTACTHSNNRTSPQAKWLNLKKEQKGNINPASVFNTQHYPATWFFRQWWFSSSTPTLLQTVNLRKLLNRAVQNEWLLLCPVPSWPARTTPLRSSRGRYRSTTWRTWATEISASVRCSSLGKVGCADTPDLLVWTLSWDYNHCVSMYQFWTFGTFFFLLQQSTLLIYCSRFFFPHGNF